MVMMLQRCLEISSVREKSLVPENEIIIMITGSVRRKDDEPDGNEK